ncbi:MAG: hypothetical protein [Circular genetic element sp.]|nr:MAG: hypothetical protein [Circular genetic element sp.]
MPYRKTRYPVKKATGRFTRKSSVKKPYGGSRYGNDAFVKVEVISALAATADNEIFSTMRVCNGIEGTPGNLYLVNQDEFRNFIPLYARYEVVGMKAEVTLSPRNTYAQANLAAGLAPSLPTVAQFPSIGQNLTYPV